MSGQMFERLTEPFAMKTPEWHICPVSNRMRRYVCGWQYREMTSEEEAEENELNIW